MISRVGRVGIVPNCYGVRCCLMCLCRWVLFLCGECRGSFCVVFLLLLMYSVKLRFVLVYYLLYWIWDVFPGLILFN